MKIGIHNGLFHADDVFALAVLRLAGKVDAVVRTRDPKLLATCDLRVDVGRRYDPAAGDFDHHQEGGAGERTNGLRYASFGLIWKQYGTEVAGSAAAASYVDEHFVQFIDADDNGQTPFTSTMPQAPLPLISQSIGAFNPTWLEPGDEASFDAAFKQAADIALELLHREIQEAQSFLQAADYVRDALQKNKGELLILDKFVPWQEIVINEAPEVLYAIFPRADGTWALQAARKNLGGFENRRDLPAAWAGKVDAELAEITGVPDAIFCHTGRFLAVAKSREGVLKLAEVALQIS
jgi:uncharacterized UPF0160 family protein